MPPWFWLPLAIVAIAALGVLAFRHTVALCVLWLMIAGATLEMTLGDSVGPGAYQTTIAAVKAAELGARAAVHAALRAFARRVQPGLAFLAMFLVGLAHGLHPDLTAGGQPALAAGFRRTFRLRLQSAVARLGRGDGPRDGLDPAAVGGWRVWRSTLAGLRPLFLDSGGERLAGLGHPAFLAGFCLAAIYACLIELYRDGRSRWLLLLAANS